MRRWMLRRDGQAQGNPWSSDRGMSNEGFVMVKVSGSPISFLAAVDEHLASLLGDSGIPLLSASVRTRSGSEREVSVQSRCGGAIER